jgi:hypothetical protein
MTTASARRALACLSLSAVALTALAGLSACSQQDSSSTAGSPTSSPTTSVSPTKTPPTKGTHGAGPSESPPAPASVKPVIRDGVRPHPSISAKPQPFDRPVTYPDGVKLAVTGIHQGRVTGQGPGVVAGPKTTFDLRFTNGSNQAISLDQVVPTAEFGSPARLARPVYDDRTQDFATTVKPGATATATYAFSIPKDELSHVVIHLDFDGRHVAATFRGSAS